MFPSLKYALEGCGAAQENGLLHLITETPYVSSNPLIVYHLLNCINSERSICFLSFQNTWSHYCNISSKLGVNLRSKMYENTIKIVELMKLLPEILNQTKSDNIFSFLTEKQEIPLKNLYIYLKRIIENLKENGKPLALIIDSLTPLLNLGIPVKEIGTFIYYCHNLLKAENGILVISCCTGKEDAVSKDLVRRLSFLCPIVLAVKELSTGRSKDIHGELNISTNLPSFNYTGQRRDTKFHYKIEERDIQVFPIGFANKTL